MIERLCWWVSCVCVFVVSGGGEGGGGGGRI